MESRLVKKIKKKKREEGIPSIISTLYEKKDLMTEDDKYELMKYAVDMNEPVMVKHLLRIGVDPNLIIKGHTILYYAFSKFNSLLAEELIEAGADFNLRPRGKGTAFYELISNENKNFGYTSLDILLEHTTDFTNREAVEILYKLIKYEDYPRHIRKITEYITDIDQRVGPENIHIFAYAASAKYNNAMAALEGFKEKFTNPPLFISEYTIFHDLLAYDTYKVSKDDRIKIAIYLLDNFEFDFSDFIPYVFTKRYAWDIERKLDNRELYSQFQKRIMLAL